MQIKAHFYKDFDFSLLHGIMIHLHSHPIFIPIPIPTYQTHPLSWSIHTALRIRAFDRRPK